MIVENGKIIEATRRELYRKYLDEGWDYITPFPAYLWAMEQAGAKIVEEESMNERERMIKLIQDAVGGCARHWAALIADKLMQNGVGFKGISIDELDLSVLSYNALKRSGINTIEELKEWDEARLLSVRNIGKKIVEEVMEKLAKWEKRRAEDDTGE